MIGLTTLQNHTNEGGGGGGWGSAIKKKKSTSWADVLTFPTFAPFFGVKTESQNFLLNVQCFIQGPVL